VLDQFVEKTLQQICTSLNDSVNANTYIEIFKKHENSVDFMTDGELKKIIGFSFYIDPRLRLDLSPIPVVENEVFIGIKLKMSLRARMMDFTTGKVETIQNYDYFSVIRYPFRGIEERSWLAKINQLHKEIQATKTRLQRLYTPSKRLSLIVGTEQKTKYQILDLVSDYILKNKLRYPNGDIKIDGDLKPFYPKNCVCVSENVLFDTLRENTLTSEAQVHLFALQAGNPRRRQAKLLQLNTGSKSSIYLHQPIT
jgi:hypothetical protein